MKNAKYTKLGILIVFSIAILIWGLSFLKGNDIFNQNDYYHVYYNRVDGLVKSNEVTLNGFQIGQVTEVKFAPDNSGRLIVTFAVNSSFKIPVESTARIISSDIMGTRSIEIVYSGEDEMYQSNDTIQGSIEAGLKDQVSMQVLPLKNKAEELLSTVDSAITVLTVIFNEDARENLSTSFEKINQTVANIEATTADLQEIMESEKGNVRSIVSNIEELTATFKNNAAEFEATLKNLNSFSDTLANVSVTPILNNLADASAKIENVLEKLNSEDNSAGLLLNDDELYQSINMLSENLGFLIGDIQQNPKRYLQVSAFDFGKEVYINTKDDASAKDIVFKVHLVSTKSKLSTDADIFESIDNIEEYHTGDVYNYLTGSTSKYSEIEEIYQNLRFQFPGSSIVAFKNGRLIKLKKALKQIR
ncbi:MlaD family protein [Draconibacterium halophilum]|uniref:MCE family protein n=1 Tax=Draconibacterium halophilum TaxID=2706887 RepID=A0A6C0REZ2_9BACT|nr:MlaD family protein [Draconibacterium halophilum]QIA08103.1 MCE family protein [Draconibacterium halophilum]